MIEPKSRKCWTPRRWPRPRPRSRPPKPPVAAGPTAAASPVELEIRGEQRDSPASLGTVEDQARRRRNKLEEAEMLYRAREQDYRAAKFAEDVARFELEMAKAALLHAQCTPGRHRPPTPRPATSMRSRSSRPSPGRVLRVFQESATVVHRRRRVAGIGRPDGPGSRGRRAVQRRREHRPRGEGVPGTMGRSTAAGSHRAAGGASAFMKISALGVEEQRVNVILDLDEPAGTARSLGDAFRVEARIVIWERRTCCRPDRGPVPPPQRVGGVCRGRERSCGTVKVGHRNSLAAEVLEGLRRGPGDPAS